MITSLEVRGFKSWRDSGRLPLGKLTGFFGPNSSGKTSLLQLLLMLKQTSESADRTQVLHLGTDRTLVGLGVLRDVLHGHADDSTLEWSISWELGRPIEVRDPEDPKTPIMKGSHLALSATILADGDNGQGRVHSLHYSFADRTFSYELGETAKSGYRLTVDGNEAFFRRSRGRPRTALPPPIRSYGFPDEVRAGFQNAGFLSDFELAFERLMGRLTYLGPLRDYPHRQYTWAGDQPEDMGTRGERWVNALLASRSQGRRKHWGHRTLESHVAWWLKELGLISQFRVEPVAEGSNLFRVWVKTTPKASEVLITDVGFGVSQILPVIVLCFYAPEGSVVILEQPEIHLHPSVQAGLADVVIDAIQKRGIQVILESHSEYLLRRLQRRIAEEKLAAEDTALYFCHLEGGESKAERLRLNLYGYIENWPQDFFGDQMEEVAEMAAAAQRRDTA